MPRGQVEKIVESRGTMSPQPTSAFPLERIRPPHPGLQPAETHKLAQTLLSISAADRAEALRGACDVLGSGLRADRVAFYLQDRRQDPRHSDFRRVESWFASDSPSAHVAFPGTLDLDGLSRRETPKESKSDDAFQDFVTPLSAGEVVRLGGAASFEGALAGMAKIPAAAAWSGARSILLVPCVGPNAEGAKVLLGVFMIEAGLAASAWSEASIDQARLVGTLVAGFLERHRLTGELAGIRKRREHDEGLEILGRVAGSVAHDFNNVLTAILGYAELLEMDLAERGNVAPELLEIQEAATRASDLVEQVLDFGRPSRSATGSLDLSRHVERMASMIRRVVGKEFEVGLDLAEGLDRVVVDPGRLERALLNLASNARTALSSDPDTRGRFDLSTRLVRVDAEGCESTGDSDPVDSAPPGLAPGRYVRLTARDNGCGIAPENRARIFEPFFTTRSEEGGTGLGLVSVAEVVEEVGGAIRVESEPGAGTAFHLYFPIESGSSAPAIERRSKKLPPSTV